MNGTAGDRSSDYGKILLDHRAKSCHSPIRRPKQQTEPNPMTTYKVAMAAGQDAANRQMRAAGRAAWNEADWNLASAIVAKLLAAS